MGQKATISLSQAGMAAMCQSRPNLPFRLAVHFGPVLKNGMALSMIREMLGQWACCRYQSSVLYLLVQRGPSWSSRSLPSGVRKEGPF
jgi:hypothetical protein